MLKLFIDSSRMELVLGVFGDDGVLKEVVLETSGKHSEYIMAEIESILSDLDIELDQIEEVICTRGPGSFTGVRIGATIAKTLAFAKGITLKSISTLRALSYTGFDNRVVVMDAKKGNVFAAIYRGDEPILEDCNIPFTSLVEKLSNLEGSVSITVDGKYEDNQELTSYGELFKERVVLEELIDDSSLKEEDAIAFAPVYLKLTDAEIQYNERINK